MNDPAVEFIGINTLFCEPDRPKEQKVFDSFSGERVWRCLAAGGRRYASRAFVNPPGGSYYFHIMSI